MDEYEKFLEKHITTCDHIDIGTGRRAMLDMALTQYRSFKAKDKAVELIPKMGGMVCPKCSTIVCLPSEYQKKDKAVEPLAVICDKKGHWLNVNHHNNIWRVYGSVTDGLTVKVSEWSFEAPTYDIAEQAARAWLEKQTDKE